MHRSPPVRAGSSSSPGSAGSVAQRAPAGGRQAEAPASNSDGPKPKVTVSRAACRPTASPVSCGGASALAVGVADRPPGRHPRRGAASTSRSRSRRSLARSAVARRRRRRSAAGPAPAWRCRPGGAPWNGDDAASRASARRRRTPSARPSGEAAARRRRRPPTPAAAEQRAARQRAIATPTTPSPATLESGSASASITTAEACAPGSCAARCRGRSRRRPVRPQRRVDQPEAPLDPVASAGSLPASAGRMRVERRAGAVDVGLEVQQVDVRVALLLAGDLRLGDLAQQLVGAVADLGGSSLTVAHQRCSCARRPRGSSASCAVPVVVSRTHSLLLDRVEARPLRLRDVVGAGVDARVEVAEGSRPRARRARRAHAPARTRAGRRRGRRGPARRAAHRRRSPARRSRARGRPGSRRRRAAASGASAAPARAPLTVSERVLVSAPVQRSVSGRAAG